MKYFFDCEFIEGFHKPLFGKRRHFIDLISIGVICEDGREYYAVSNEFNLKKVWNKYDLDYGSGDQRNKPPRKIYWLRENVLRPIFEEWRNNYNGKIVRCGLPFPLENRKMTYKKMKKIILKYAGKPNKQIAKEIIDFVYKSEYPQAETSKQKAFVRLGKISPEFYAYYADYDWVLFCSLFGRMIDLPNGFPMYCKDLKQMFDQKFNDGYVNVGSGYDSIEAVKSRKDYPKQENEHNALADAKWNFQLYKFLQSI